MTRYPLFFLSLFAIFALLFGVQPDEARGSLCKADKVVVVKSKRLMLVMGGGEVLKVYKVALGKRPVGPKIVVGDKKTPEGTYVLDARKADSRFHKAIHISYPNEADIARAMKNGASPGGDIMIHGLPENFKNVGALHRVTDWTDGCIAVTNNEIEEIWKIVPDGTPIEIKP
ncbi:MAG: L,D-transpeptidase family protein [Nitrospirota bacterium]